MKTKILLVTALVGAAAMTASARVSFNFSIGLPIFVSPPAVVCAPPPCPPPVVVESAPPCPGVDYVWVGGYWNYRPTGYVWVRGNWCSRPVQSWHGYGHDGYGSGHESGRNYGHEHGGGYAGNGGHHR